MITSDHKVPTTPFTLAIQITSNYWICNYYTWMKTVDEDDKDTRRTSGQTSGWGSRRPQNTEQQTIKTVDEDQDNHKNIRQTHRDRWESNSSNWNNMRSPLQRTHHNHLDHTTTHHLSIVKHSTIYHAYHDPKKIRNAPYFIFFSAAKPSNRGSLYFIIMNTLNHVKQSLVFAVRRRWVVASAFLKVGNWIFQHALLI